MGEREEYAVRQHQWRQNGFPTSGVSTTPHIDRAKHYAQKEKVIAKINRDLCSQFKIKEYVVKEMLEKYPKDIAIPEDEEVILASENNGNFPKEIIEEIIKI